MTSIYSQGYSPRDIITSYYAPPHNTTLGFKFPTHELWRAHLNHSRREGKQEGGKAERRAGGTEESL
jgi:hypothetical protein